MAAPSSCRSLGRNFINCCVRACWSLSAVALHLRHITWCLRFALSLIIPLLRDVTCAPLHAHHWPLPRSDKVTACCSPLDVVLAICQYILDLHQHTSYLR